MFKRALKTRQWNFKKLSSTYYPLCNLCHHWKGFLWGKTTSLWLSPKLAGENIQEAGQVLLSLTDTILQRSVLHSYAKFSLAGNTRLFQAHAVLVLCIYSELCPWAAPPNPSAHSAPAVSAGRQAGCAAAAGEPRGHNALWRRARPQREQRSR